MFKLLNNIARNIRSKPATRRYPYVRRPAMAGSRGHLEIDADQCIYCGICATRCPSKALTVVKKPKRWTFEPYRCIVCGYCVEGCPKKCLAMNPQHGK